MRIWSIHPKYLDAKGLIALWREALLAKHVLEDKTKGYKNHPQLKRFKNCPQSLHAINYYLSIVQKEAEERGYRFDATKIERNFDHCSISVTKGQIDYEVQHLKNKLQQRDVVKLKEITSVNRFDTHPLFKVVKGDIEDWEIIK